MDHWDSWANSRAFVSTGVFYRKPLDGVSADSMGFFVALTKAAEHDQRWSFAFFLASNCQSICEDFFGPKALENFGFHDSVWKAVFAYHVDTSVRGKTPYDRLCFVDILPIILM